MDMQNKEENMPDKHIIATTNTKTTIAQQYDMQFEIVGIEIDKRTSISDYKDIIIYYNGSIICSVPLNIYFKLSKKMIGESSTYISTKSPHFFLYQLLPVVPLYNLFWCNVEVVLTSYINVNFALHVKYTRIENNIRINDDQCEVRDIKTIKYETLKSVSEISIPCNKHGLNTCGFLLESTKIGYLDVNINETYCTKYDKSKLNIHKIYKKKWSRCKNNVFGIIMEKILPREMINHIEEYIMDTYLYYIPIDSCGYYQIYDKKNDGSGSINIKFKNKFSGNIYYLYHNQIIYFNNTGDLRILYDLYALY